MKNDLPLDAGRASKQDGCGLRSRSESKVSLMIVPESIVIATVLPAELVPQVEGPNQAMKITGVKAQQLRGLDVVAIHLR